MIIMDLTANLIVRTTKLDSTEYVSHEYVENISKNIFKPVEMDIEHYRKHILQ